MPRPAAHPTALALLTELKNAFAQKNANRALLAIGKLRAFGADPRRLAVDEAKARYLLLDEITRPIALLVSVPESSPFYAGAQEFLSRVHRATGDKAKAIAAARRAVAADPVAALLAFATLVEMTPEACPEILPEVEAVVATGRLAPERLAIARNTLGRIFDKLGDTDRAFAEFSEAKRLRATPFNVEAEQRTLDMMRAGFERAFFERRRAAGSPAARPTFIIGLARSGSSILEKTLGAHSAVTACGETVEFSQAIGRMAAIVGKTRGRTRLQALLEAPETYAAAPDALIRRTAATYLDRTLRRAPDGADSALRLTDKTLHNYVHVAGIKLVFPEAKILNTERDLRDVFVSCLMQSFADPIPYSNDQVTFAYFAIIYEELMNFWRELFPDDVMDVRYEDLVGDVEATAARALAHIGLDWDAACARPHEAAVVTRTASAHQVTQPINKKALGRWRRYEKHLGPLLDILERYEAAKRAA